MSGCISTGGRVVSTPISASASVMLRDQSLITWRGEREGGGGYKILGGRASEVLPL